MIIENTVMTLYGLYTSDEVNLAEKWSKLNNFENWILENLNVIIKEIILINKFKLEWSVSQFLYFLSSSTENIIIALIKFNRI
jgi:hypothetical protein